MKGYRRQIKTTLGRDKEKIFDNICEEKKCTEAQFVRDAVSDAMTKTLQTIFSDQATNEAKELQQA